MAVLNPLRARLFAEACGQLAKTDRVDAKLLAGWGCSQSGRNGRLISADPALARRCTILISIPGIGPSTAATLLAGLSEMGTLNAKQAAMPRPCRSRQRPAPRTPRNQRRM